MTDDWNWDPHQCLYADDDAKRFVGLGALLVAIVAGACLGCALYGFAAWVMVCP